MNVLAADKSAFSDEKVQTAQVCDATMLNWNTTVWCINFLVQYYHFELINVDSLSFFCQTNHLKIFYTKDPLTPDRTKTHLP